MLIYAGSSPIILWWRIFGNIWALFLVFDFFIRLYNVLVFYVILVLGQKIKIFTIIITFIFIWVFKSY